MLLPILLAGCVFERPYPSYTVTETQLLFKEASERWSYFYGDPQVISLGQRSLALTSSNQQHIWAVKDALWVDNQPVLREVGPALVAPAKLVYAFPSGVLVVHAYRNVERSWLYDGSWKRLTGKVPEGESVEAAPDRETPNLEDFSSSEEQVLLKEILARAGGKVVALFQLDPVFEPNRFEPRPFTRRTAALSVQYGVPTEFILMWPDQVRTKVISQGTDSAFTGDKPVGYLATNLKDYSMIWNLVVSNLLPKPPMPSVNLNQNSVVAFFLGQKRTGGYSVRFVRAERNDSTLVIVLQISQPAPGSAVTQAFTSPHIVLEVSGRFTKVEYRDTSGNLLAKAP